MSDFKTVTEQQIGKGPPEHYARQGVLYIDEETGLLYPRIDRLTWGAPISGGAGAGSVAVLYKTRIVNYSEFLDDGAGGAVVDPFLTIPAGGFITAIGIVATETFDDSGSAEGSVDLNIKIGSDVSTHSLADASVNVPPTSQDTPQIGGIIATSNVTYSPFGAAQKMTSVLLRVTLPVDLVLRLQVWSGDGTTGKCYALFTLIDEATPYP